MSVKEEKNQQHKEFASKISDEINCSICLDILVNPLTLVPCGHSFCTNCCLSESTRNGRRRRTLCFDKCPHCRQPINETAPSRQLESLIDTLVTVPNLLFSNEDDKKQYLARREVENERSRVLTAPSRPKKRRRHEIRNVLAIPLQRPSSDDSIGNFRRRFAHRFPPVPFDHMAAPLPPPFDHHAMMWASSAEPSAPPTRRRAPTSAVAISRVISASDPTTGTRGVSASDPICID